MKVIVCLFEQLLGLSINFHKSEIYCFGKESEVKDEYRHAFRCEVRSFTFKYLGIPILYRALLKNEWKLIQLSGMADEGE